MPGFLTLLALPYLSYNLTVLPHSLFSRSYLLCQRQRTVSKEIPANVPPDDTLSLSLSHIKLAGCLCELSRLGFSRVFSNAFRSSRFHFGPFDIREICLALICFTIFVREKIPR